VVVIHKKAGRALKRSAKGKAHGVKLKAESSRLQWLNGVNSSQAVEKRPSAAFPSSFVVTTYIQVRLTRQVSLS